MSGLLATFAVSAFSAVGAGTGTPPDGMLGQPYTYTFTGSGGTPPYNFLVTSGAVPSGLTLSSTGILSGTPSQSGSFKITLRAIDSQSVSGSTDFTVRIVNSNGLQLTTTDIPVASRGNNYQFSVLAQGGAAPYSFDLVPGGGALPLGLSIDNTGKIQGTPIVAGTFPVSIRVTDKNGISSQSSLSLNVTTNALTIINSSVVGGMTGSSYSQTFTAAGGTAPYSYAISSGSLPSGLTLSNGGILAGTPTTSGSYPFFVRVTDANNQTAQSSYTVAVSQGAFSINDTVLTSAQTGVAYNQQLSSQGGIGTVTYVIATGSLAPGLTLSANGALAGSATATGSYQFSIRAIDSNGQSATRNFSINVNSGPFAISNASLPAASLGQPFNSAFTFSGGTAPYVVTLSSGLLPPGLSLAQSGAITGTPTGTAGNYFFVIRAQDASGQVTQSFYTINVGNNALNFSAGGLTAGQVGSQYTGTLSAVNGSGPYTFTLISGVLPAGLTLASNGNVSGTPTSGGVYQTTFRVMDANGASATQSLTLFVNSSGFNVRTYAIPSARLNQPYTMNLSGNGGVPPYTFQLIDGTLPAGITLTSAGVLSGSPSAAGIYTFTLRAGDSVGSTSNVTYTLNVNNSDLSVGPVPPSNGQVGLSYNSAFTASGGTGPYTFDVPSGALPPGLALSPSGVLTGTPTAGGQYNFTVRLSDSTGASSLFTFSQNVGTGSLAIATQVLQNGVLGLDFFSPIMATGGSGPYTFTIASGSLPTGVTLSANGTLTGAPTATGSYPVSIRVTDAGGNTATSNFTILINGAGSLTIGTTSLPTAKTNQTYSSLIMASGGLQPYTFVLVSGSLPNGITLGSNGLLSGVSTVDGTSTFAVRVTDALGATAQASLTIGANSSNLTLMTTSFVNGRLGENFQQGLQATGGSGIYTYTIVGGTLPAGLTLNGNSISGTPTRAGSFPIVVRVTDSSGASYQTSYNLLVGTTALAFTNISLPAPFSGSQYFASLQAAGGVAPYQFSILAGTLPVGLTLSPGGDITGSATGTSASTLTFRVVDATGASATTALTLAAPAKSSLQLGFTSIPSASVGQFYLFTPSASGGTGPYVFSVAAPLPVGLFLTPVGNLAGTPKVSGTYTIVVRGQDALGVVVQDSFQFVVLGSGFQITTLTVPNGRVNQTFNFNLVSSGSNGATRYEIVSGTLPPGLTLSSTGALSGTPTAAGAYRFTIRATDAQGATTQADISVNITASGLAFSTMNLASGTVNAIYGQTLTVNGGTAPYTFIVRSGQLPAGLSLSAAGVLSGTPTAAGTFPVTIRATDASGMTVDYDYRFGVGVVGAPSILAIASAANYTTNGVVPGEVVVLYGANVGPANIVTFQTLNGGVPTILSTVRVLFDGVAAPILYANATQIAVVVPYSVAGKQTVRITTEYLGSTSTEFAANVLSARPALFTVNSSGTGAGAVLNQDGSVNTASNPARKDSVVVLYITGAGTMTPAGVDGQIATGMSALTQAVTVSINQQPATVQYSGNAPGLIQGVVQLNVKLPAITISGPNTIALTVGSTSTTTVVTVFVE